MFNNDKRNYLILLAILISIFLIMLPFKDQVFSEDFAYAQSVKHLILTGDLKISERVGPSSITHIFLGSIIASILGFSLGNLHIAVVALLPFMLLAFYKTLRLAGNTPQRSFLFTLFFLSIPWILQLSYTFLTDVTFLTMEVFSLLFYLTAFRKNSTKYLLLGSVFASLAFLTRQLGLAIVLAAVVTIFLKRENREYKIKNLLLVSIAPLAAAALYFFWLKIPGNATIAQLSVISEFKVVYFHSEPSIVIGNIARIIHRALAFVSQALVLFSPLILLFIISNSKKALLLLKANKTKFMTISTIVFSIYALDIVNFRNEYTFGFPLLIYDYESLFPIPWAHIWKFLVLLGLPVLGFTVFSQRTKIYKLTSFVQFILLCSIFLTAMTVIHVASWDHYIVPLLPLIILWVANLTKKLKLNNNLAFVVILLLLIDSLQMTKFRYTQSGLIWYKAKALVQTGVSPKEIDANNNFGWYYWFYYEKIVNDQIRKNNGSKAGLNYGFEIDKPKLPKYRIYSPKMIGYTRPNMSHYNIVPIAFNSLFVNSQIYFMQLKKDK